MQQDGRGSNRLFHHAKNSDGVIRQYWLEAESSEHKVGGEQKESEGKREDAIRRAKAQASVLGRRGMGSRFNVLMTVQIPLKQKPNSKIKRGGGTFSSKGGGGKMYGAPEMDWDGFSNIS